MTPKIAIVGEAWGEHEEQLHHPFVGASGLELGRMLYEAGLVPVGPPDMGSDASGNPRRQFVGPKQMLMWWAMQPSLRLFNVLNTRPPGNKLDDILVPAKDSAVGFPALRQGKYFPQKLIDEHVKQLWADLTLYQPTLILALGNTACWALLRNPKISQIRGAVAPSPWGKVLPTFHPAAVLREWSYRTVVVMDLMKAKREAQFPEVRRPERQVLVNPTLREIHDWIYVELEGDLSRPVAADIETAFGQITTIGFSARPENAISIPFVDYTKPGWNYWETVEHERFAWNLCRSILEGPWPKVGQNFLYDLQYILRKGCRPRNVAEDTMLLHHSLFSELQKGLGFLGSIYTNEASWKLMRNHGEDLKRDE